MRRSAQVGGRGLRSGDDTLGGEEGTAAVEPHHEHAARDQQQAEDTEADNRIAIGAQRGERVAALDERDTLRGLEKGEDNRAAEHKYAPAADADGRHVNGAGYQHQADQHSPGATRGHHRVDRGRRHPGHAEECEVDAEAHEGDTRNQKKQTGHVEHSLR
ncbi:MAG: hypothetical protein JWN49_599 [Parcubacteria group bacterium]|nr:hypothetical protein [Parcubacteria group bacterium]